MKKNTIFVIALALIGLVAQTLKGQEADNGQWFRFADQNYQVTMDDVNDIALLSDQGNLVAGKLYQTRSGTKFYTKYPSQWRTRELAILSKVRGTQVTSLVAGFSGGTIVQWNPNNILSKSDNYYINNGVEGFFKNYSGGNGIYAVKVNGYPVMKVGAPCFNPEDPYMTAVQQPAATPPPTNTGGTGYVGAPRDTQPTGCPCGDYVACADPGIASGDRFFATGVSWNQHDYLLGTTHPQLPTMSGTMYTSLGQNPQFQNAVYRASYEATYRTKVIWVANGTYSSACCPQKEVTVVNCPCGSTVQPCPCNQTQSQSTPAKEEKKVKKDNTKFWNGVLVAALVGVGLYAILNHGAPGTGGPVDALLGGGGGPVDADTH